MYCVSHERTRTILPPGYCTDPYRIPPLHAPTGQPSSYRCTQHRQTSLHTHTIGSTHLDPNPHRRPGQLRNESNWPRCCPSKQPCLSAMPLPVALLGMGAGLTLGNGCTKGWLHLPTRKGREWTSQDRGHSFSSVFKLVADPCLAFCISCNAFVLSSSLLYSIFCRENIPIIRSDSFLNQVHANLGLLACVPPCYLSPMIISANFR